jgi:hypothetical protein
VKAPHTLAFLVAGLAAASLFLNRGLRQAAFLKVLQFNLARMSRAEEATLAGRLRGLRGVRDVSVDARDQLWVQCDTRQVDEAELRRIVHP